MRRALIASVAAGALLAAGARAAQTGSLPRGSEPVRLDPASFTTRIDNRTGR